MIFLGNRGATRGREPMPVSFKGAHFPQEIILTCVRWYVAYPLRGVSSRGTDFYAPG